MHTDKPSNGPGANAPEITLIIQTIKGDKANTFPKQSKVAEVIDWLIKECGFVVNPGDRFELVLASKPTEVLQPNRTLVSYHLEDDTRLILTMITSGV